MTLVLTVVYSSGDPLRSPCQSHLPPSNPLVSAPHAALQDGSKDYSIKRDDVDYIMETFPIMKRKEEKQYGEYRTKRVILEIYDEMKRADNAGLDCDRFVMFIMAPLVVFEV
jgi:hypothetical protein